jgi:hypothetical protein
MAFPWQGAPRLKPKRSGHPRPRLQTNSRLLRGVQSLPCPERWLPARPDDHESTRFLSDEKIKQKATEKTKVAAKRGHASWSTSDLFCLLPDMAAWTKAVHVDRPKPKFRHRKRTKLWPDTFPSNQNSF